jgi:hypothetical protein
MYYFAVCIALPLFFAGCCIEKHCEAFDERFVLFAPLELEKGDILTYRSNYGNVSGFQVTEKSISGAYEYETCSCGCNQSYEIYLACTGRQFKQMHFSLNYDDGKPASIVSTISLGRQYHSFFIHTKNSGGIAVTGTSVINNGEGVETFPLPLIDSMLINKTWYYDLIELTDSEQTIHIAKTKGVVQIAEKDGEVWWLNEQDKTE